MTDTDAFINHLYEEYYNPIVRYCTAALGGDESDGELCAHEVFEEAFRCRDKLMSHPSVIGWLRVTAKHRVSRFLRERQKRSLHEVHITDLSEKYLESVQYIEDYDEAFEEDIPPLVEKVLSGLDDDERNIYELRFRQNMTFREIGEALGISESAARMRTVRTELRIRQVVAKLMSQ